MVSFVILSPLLTMVWCVSVVMISYDGEDWDHLTGQVTTDHDHGMNMLGRGRGGGLVQVGSHSQTVASIVLGSSGDH